MRFGSNIQHLLAQARRFKEADAELPIELALALMDCGIDPRDL